MKKIFCFTFLVLLLNFAIAKDYKIKDIQIKGNKRIEKETIFSYLPDDYKVISDEGINTTLSELYETGHFEDIKISVKKNILQILVKENPSINRIAFEGNDDISNEILKLEVGILPRHSLSIAHVKEAIEKIKRIYRYKGFYLANITPRIIRRLENRVDLIFEIKEGKKTKIGRIVYIGNSRFSDVVLSNIIQTKETRWYRFFSSSDSYDPDRLAYDQELLRLFYLKNGYADFQIKAAVVELDTISQEFFMTFNLSEGEVYKFGDIKVTSDIKDIDKFNILQNINLKKGDRYNNSLVERAIAQITKTLGENGYAFIEIVPETQKDEKNNLIHFNFNILESSKVYIEKIIIQGNTKTNEEVIRRELLFYEGDAFNLLNMELSERRVRNLGLFKSVKFKRDLGRYPDRVVITVEIEEDKTTELSVGGGYSTLDGLLLNARYAEHNFMGKGQTLRFETTWGKKKHEFDIAFTEPYFMNKNIGVGINLYNITNKKNTNQYYNQKIHGITLSLGYGVSDDVIQRWSYTLRQGNITDIDKNTSEFIKEQKGRSVLSELGHSISYDKRDNRINPGSGWMVGLSNDLAGLGGSIKYLKNAVFGSIHYTIIDDHILSITGKISKILKIGKKIRIIDRYNLGGDSLRGFEISGIGPRDRKKHNTIGGLASYTASAELILPIGLPDEFGIKGALFSDIGNVFNGPESKNDVTRSKKMRMSIGFGIRWNSPMGPLKIDFAKAIRKAKLDETRSITFGMSTRF